MDSILAMQDPIVRDAIKYFMHVAAGGSAWNLRLAKYAAADLPGRLQLLLEDSHVNSLPEDQLRLKAVLCRLPFAEQEEAVLKLLSEQANSRLAWCCQLIRAEASNLQVGLTFSCFPEKEDSVETHHLFTVHCLLKSRSSFHLSACGMLLAIFTP